MRASSTLADHRRFLGAWAADPRRVASVVPSGRALGERINAGIEAGSGPVIELGPGTGVFTRALIARGVPASELVLVERGPGFADLLKARFPEAEVVRMDATGLRHLRWRADRKAGSVVSGLPLLPMPAARVMAILVGAFAHLREGGSFRQFTYGPRCPIPAEVLDRLDLRARGTGWVLGNLPPAQVFHVTRRRAMPATARAPQGEGSR